MKKIVFVLAQVLSCATSVVDAAQSQSVADCATMTAMGTMQQVADSSMQGRQSTKPALGTKPLDASTTAENVSAYRTTMGCVGNMDRDKMQSRRNDLWLSVGMVFVLILVVVCVVFLVWYVLPEFGKVHDALKALNSSMAVVSRRIDETAAGQEDISYVRDDNGKVPTLYQLVVRVFRQLGNGLQPVRGRMGAQMVDGRNDSLDGIKAMQKSLQQMLGEIKTKLDGWDGRLSAAGEMLTEAVKRLDDARGGLDKAKKTCEDACILNEGKVNELRRVVDELKNLRNEDLVAAIPVIRNFVQDEERVLQSNNASLRGRLEELKKDLDDANANIAMLKEEKESAEWKCSESSRVCDELREKAESQDVELKALNQKLEDEQRKYASKQEEIDAIISQNENIDDWRMSLFPAWCANAELESFFVRQAEDFRSSPTPECLAFQGALLEMKAGEELGTGFAIEKLLDLLGKTAGLYCHARRDMSPEQIRDVLAKMSTAVIDGNESIAKAGIYLRVPRIGAAPEKWMHGLTSSAVSRVKSWAVFSQAGLITAAEVE